MDLRGRQQRQASKPSPRRSRSSKRSSYFNNYNGSAHQKIRAAHSIRVKSDFTTTRIRFEFKLQGEVLSECFQETEFFFGKIPEHNPKQLGLPSEFFQEVEFFSIWARQHGKILSGIVQKIFQSKIRDTTDRSSGGSHANDNIARLYHPLARFRS